MKKWNKPVKTALAALSLCAAGFGLNAMAAPPDAGGYGPGYGCDGGGMGYGMGMGHGKGNAVDPRIAEVWKERIAQRHAEIAAQLKLNPDQQTAWQAYTATMASHFTNMPGWNPEEFAKLTAPERMEKMIGLMKERNDKMTEQLSALKTFYGKLSAEQQKTFDTQTLGYPHSNRRGRGSRY